MALHHMHYLSGTTGSERFVTEISGFKVLETDLAAGSVVPMHTHENATIVLTLEGDYKERYRGAWEPHAPLTLIAKPAGEHHANAIGEKPARCLVVELTEARVKQFARMGFLWDAPLVQVRPSLAMTGLKMSRELRRGDKLSPLLLESAALELVGQICRGVPPTYSNEPRWMRQAVELIHDGPYDTLRLSRVAAIIGIHPVHLARTFKRVHGCSVGAYVRRLQVTRAVHRLSETSESVSDVAAATGFYDQSHMVRTMRREIGLTPSEIRAA
jgi:AraC family transcriptional regulator